MKEHFGEFKNCKKICDIVEESTKCIGLRCDTDFSTPKNPFKVRKTCVDNCDQIIKDKTIENIIKNKKINLNEKVIQIYDKLKSNITINGKSVDCLLLTGCPPGKYLKNNKCIAYAGKCKDGNLIELSKRTKENHCGSCKLGMAVDFDKNICRPAAGVCKNGTLIEQSKREGDNHCGSCNTGYYLKDKKCLESYEEYKSFKVCSGKKNLLKLSSSYINSCYNESKTNAACDKKFFVFSPKYRNCFCNKKNEKCSKTSNLSRIEKAYIINK